MLTIYRDGTGSARAGAGKLPDEVIWIDLLNPTEDEKAFVESRSGLRVPTFEALSEIESSSRLIVDHGVIYLSTPIVAQGDTADYHSSPEGFILSPSVQRFLSTLAFGARDVTYLASLMVKPASSVMMTFTSDPNRGLSQDHFSGSAIVFLSTITTRPAPLRCNKRPSFRAGPQGRTRNP